MCTYLVLICICIVLKYIIFWYNDYKFVEMTRNTALFTCPPFMCNIKSKF